jgi:outer membrane lipoprotein-sorting protein
MAIRSRLRWFIPVGVAAVAVGASAALPALTASADQPLPTISAESLLSHALASNVNTFSGDISTTSDLGIPALPDQARSSDLSQLITGTGTLRVAKSGEDKQRLAVLGSTTERDIVHNGRDVWVYDSGARKAQHRMLPAQQARKQPAEQQVTPDQVAKRLLATVGKDTTISVGRAGKVAGRSAYQLVLKPKSAQSLIGSVQVPIDAKTWMPLGIEVLPRNSAKPAVQAQFTSLSYAKPADSTFRFTPPAGTKVVQQKATGEQHTMRPGKKPVRHAHTATGNQFSWTRVVKVGNVSGAKGQAGAYLQQLKAAGSRVSGTFGSGTLIQTRLVTVLVLDDGRAYAGAVTPKAVEAAAAKG